MNSRDCLTSASGLPATWKRVREALEPRSPRSHQRLSEYPGYLPASSGSTRREDSLQFSGYLHDLGICLHFQEDDPVLKNTVILKPKPGERMPSIACSMMIGSDRGPRENSHLA